MDELDTKRFIVVEGARENNLKNVSLTIPSLSPYARQFLGGVDKPDVDSIEGLSPAISIDQKTTSHNPRSTVGTVTEIYDFLRLLFARVGIPYCPDHHIPITAITPVEMAKTVLSYPAGSKLIQPAASSSFQPRL